MAKANSTSISSAASIDAWEMGNVTSSGPLNSIQLHLSKKDKSGVRRPEPRGPHVRSVRVRMAHALPSITKYNHELVELSKGSSFGITFCFNRYSW